MINWIYRCCTSCGCFFLNIRENRNKTGHWVTAGFSLVQHSRDLLLFKVIQEYLGYGNLVEEKREVVRLKVENFKLIWEQVLPFFTNNPLQSSKKLNFNSFSSAYFVLRTS